MRLFSIYLLILSTAMVGCSSSSEQAMTEEVIEVESANEHFDRKIFSLIEQLTQVERFYYQQKPVAFTTLVWMDTLESKSDQRASTLLGHQISSSLKTELVQRGGIVVEHKSGKAISMSDNASYYLTRKLDELSKDIEVNYVLAGTLLEVKGGVEVNVEVIDIMSHQVVSSARSYIGNDYLPELKNIYVKDNRIYRGQL